MHPTNQWNLLRKSEEFRSSFQDSKGEPYLYVPNIPALFWWRPRFGATVHDALSQTAIYSRVAHLLCWLLSDCKKASHSPIPTLKAWGQLINKLLPSLANLFMQDIAQCHSPTLPQGAQTIEYHRLNSEGHCNFHGFRGVQQRCGLHSCRSGGWVTATRVQVMYVTKCDAACTHAGAEDELQQHVFRHV
jgi:hypothetical protein